MGRRVSDPREECSKACPADPGDGLPWPTADWNWPGAGVCGDDGMAVSPLFGFAAGALAPWPATGTREAVGLPAPGFGVSTAMAAMATSPLSADDKPVVGFAAAFVAVARTWEDGRGVSDWAT